MPNVPEPTVQATRYEVSLLPEDDINRRHFTLYVEWRGDDRWAVTTGFRDCLAADGTWSYEPRPSERDDDWIGTHRFDLNTALSMAKTHASNIRVNGHTAVDAYLRTRPEDQS